MGSLLCDLGFDNFAVCGFVGLLGVAWWFEGGRFPGWLTGMFGVGCCLLCDFAVWVSWFPPPLGLAVGFRLMGCGSLCVCSVVWG